MRQTTVGVEANDSGGRTGKNSRGERVIRAGNSGRGQSVGDALIGVMLVIVIATAVAYIGIDVLEEVQGSITDKTLSETDDGNQTNFENATEEVSGGFSSAMGLVDIVFLVLLFSVILGALLAFGR